MLLGKRPRPPMIKRTTSMTEFTVVEVEAAPPQTQSFLTPRGYFHGGHDLVDDQTAAHHFLRSCGLCRRRLAPERDIYMYRGDAAFCSLECREQQMKQDERKGKKLSQQQQQAADQEKNNHQSPHTNKNESNKSRTVAAA